MSNQINTEKNAKDLMEQMKVNIKRFQDDVGDLVNKLAGIEQRIFDEYIEISSDDAGNAKSIKEIEQKIQELSDITTQYKEAERISTFTQKFKRSGHVTEDHINIYEKYWLPILQRIVKYKFGEEDIRGWYNNIRWHGYPRVSDDYDYIALEYMKVLEWALNIPPGSTEYHLNERVGSNEDQEHPHFNVSEAMLEELNWTKNMMIEMHEYARADLNDIRKKIKGVGEDIAQLFGKMTKPDPRWINSCHEGNHGVIAAIGSLKEGLLRRKARARSTRDD